MFCDETITLTRNPSSGHVCQATATMSDGRVFVIGGSWNGGIGGKNGEVSPAGAAHYRTK